MSKNEKITDIKPFLKNNSAELPEKRHNAYISDPFLKKCLLLNSENIAEKFKLKDLFDL